MIKKRYWLILLAILIPASRLSAQKHYLIDLRGKKDIGSVYSETCFIDTVMRDVYDDTADYYGYVRAGIGLTRKTEINNLGFNVCDFLSEVDFQELDIRGDVSLTLCTFEKEIAFDGTHFNGKVFLYSRYEGNITFRKCSFIKTAFIGLALEKENSEMSFMGATLPDTLDFSSLSVNKGIVDLSGIKVDSGRIDHNGYYAAHNLVLHGCDLSKFKMNYAYFRMLTVGTDNSPTPADEVVSMFEALLKNFRDHGQQESARKLDIEYRKYKWSQKPIYMRWLGNVSDLWWLFGYEKERIFGWTFLLLSTLTVITLIFLPFLQRKVYTMEPIEKAEQLSTTRRQNIKSPYSGTRRLWYAIVYTSSLFFQITLKVEKLHFTSKFWHIVGTLYIVLVYTTGIICLAYMANLILQKV